MGIPPVKVEYMDCVGPFGVVPFIAGVTKTTLVAAVGT